MSAFVFGEAGRARVIDLQHPGGSLQYIEALSGGTPIAATYRPQDDALYVVARRQHSPYETMLVRVIANTGTHDRFQLAVAPDGALWLAAGTSYGSHDVCRLEELPVPYWQVNGNVGGYGYLGPVNMAVDARGLSTRRGSARRISHRGPRVRGAGLLLMRPTTGWVLVVCALVLAPACGDDNDATDIGQDASVDTRRDATEVSGDIRRTPPQKPRLMCRKTLHATFRSTAVPTIPSGSSCLAYRIDAESNGRSTPSVCGGVNGCLAVMAAPTSAMILRKFARSDPTPATTMGLEVCSWSIRHPVCRASIGRRRRE